MPAPNKTPPTEAVRNPLPRRLLTKMDLAPRYWCLVNGSMDIIDITNIPTEKQLIHRTQILHNDKKNGQLKHNIIIFIYLILLQIGTFSSLQTALVTSGF